MAYENGRKAKLLMYARYDDTGRGALTSLKFGDEFLHQDPIVRAEILRDLKAMIDNLYLSVINELRTELDEMRKRKPRT